MLSERKFSTTLLLCFGVSCVAASASVVLVVLRLVFGWFGEWVTFFEIAAFWALAAVLFRAQYVTYGWSQMWFP